MKKIFLFLCLVSAAIAIRPKDEATTATIAAVDDFFLLDGTTNGTRKIAALQFPNVSVGYADPSWITSLGWAKILGTPTTLAGYGITDPIVLTSGSYANPAWITSLAFSKLTGLPSPVLTVSGDATGTATFSSLGNASPILTLATVNSNVGTFAGITVNAKGLVTGATALTTLSGYGITDGVNAVANDTNFTGVVSGHTLTLGFAGSIANARLANSALTIAGHAVSLGGTQTLAASDLTNGTTGSGAVVLAASPTFTTPVLGTPVSGNLTNATGYPAPSIAVGALPNGITATTQSAYDASTKIATTAYTDSEISNQRNALAPRGGVAFDGTDNTRVTAALTGQTLGTDPYSVSLVMLVPSALPPLRSRGIYTLSSSPTTAWVANGLTCYVETDGSLHVRFFGSSTSNFNDWKLSGLVSNFGGKIIHLCVVRNSSGTLSVYINASAWPATTETTVGTPPTWQGAVASSYFALGADDTNTTLTFTVFAASLYNLALSASDVQEIYELGGAVPERYKFGSQVALNTSSIAIEEFAYDTLDGVSASGFHAVDAAAYGRVSTRPYISTISFPYGAQFRASFTATQTSGGAPQLTIFRAGVGAMSNVHTVVAGANVAILTLTSALTGAQQVRLAQFDTYSSTDYTIASLSVVRLGAVVHLLLADGYSYQLKDASTNQLHAVMSPTGVSHVLPQNRPHHIRGTTSTNGNQQAFGQVLIPANSQILNINMRAETGAPTVTMGTASGGAQLVASSGLTTSWAAKTLALAGGIVAVDTSIWIGSNSTDVVDFDILCMPLSP